MGDSSAACGSLPPCHSEQAVLNKNTNIKLQRKMIWKW